MVGARIIGIPPEASKLQFECRQQQWVPINTQVIADQQRTAGFYLLVGWIQQALDVQRVLDAGLGLTD